MGSEVDRSVPDTTPVPGSGSAAAPPRPLGRRMRALAARSMHPFGHGPANQTPLEALVAAHRAAHPKADLRLLNQAYEVAERRSAATWRTSMATWSRRPGSRESMT